MSRSVNRLTSGVTSRVDPSGDTRARGVRSQPVPVALVDECSLPVV
jgi:hypothetical protein